MQSKASTVQQYLAELPAERRAVVQAVRKVILENLDKGFEEGVLYGMIGYYVPHRLFPTGYHCDPSKPLCFAGLAAQKNHLSLYLMCVYGEEERRKRFVKQWVMTGKKLDMGKSCIRFKKLEDLALDVIAEEIRSVTAKKYVEHYVTMLQTLRPGTGTAKRAAAKKAATRTARSVKAAKVPRAAGAAKAAQKKARARA